MSPPVAARADRFVWVAARADPLNKTKKPAPKGLVLFSKHWGGAVDVCSLAAYRLSKPIRPLARIARPVPPASRLRPESLPLSDVVYHKDCPWDGPHNRRS